MIIFDTETTGLVQPSPVPVTRQPRIIEFCAVKLDDKSLKETAHIDFLIHPGVEITSKITEITGITNADLKGKPPFAKFYPQITDFFLGERFIAAHNLDFDTSILDLELQRIGCQCAFPWPPKRICTVEASFKIKGKMLRLSDLYELATNGGTLQGAHRAINDVRATAVCLRWLLEQGHAQL